MTIEPPDRITFLPDHIREIVARLRDYDVDLLLRIAEDERNARVAEGNYDPSYAKIAPKP